MKLRTDFIHRRRESYKLLLEKALKDAVDQLKMLEGVRQISVFGSFARGRRDLFTDLDILIIMDTELSMLDRLRFLYSRVALQVDVDMICYTPLEYEDLCGRGWLKSALQDAQVLYENRSI